MKWQFYVLLITWLGISDARPTFGVVADVLHEMVDELIAPNQYHEPHRQSYPCYPQSSAYGSPRNCPPGRYVPNYNSVNRPVQGYGEYAPYYDNGGRYPPQDNYIGSGGFQSPPLRPHNGPAYGYQQPNYPYRPPPRNNYPYQNY